MHAFETLLALLLGATLLASAARRFGIPYPTLLALGGAAVAFIPNGPHLSLPPDLILALFVAPILLDAAYDSSLRDLRRNGGAVASLVLAAVGLTTVVVALVARHLIPDMPWAVAIALGALVAPPDAVAALAVLRQVDPPFRVRAILEGESLLNDASALLIYRLAVVAVAAGGFSLSGAAPAFALVFVGSVIAGWIMAHLFGWAIRRFEDAPSSVVAQFVSTFVAWLLAERLGLSGVVTVVVLGLTLARRDTAPMPARLRIPSFAIWETVTRVLNVLAFTLIGLQLRPILEALSPEQRWRYLAGAGAILGVVIVVRIAWTLTHHIGVILLDHSLKRTSDLEPGPRLKGAVVVGWSGMRGIVTLAAALALPRDFPYRDFIQLTAFVVVLGTLVLQGLTLRPLMALLKLPKDTVLDDELALARKTALKAAMAELGDDDCAAADRLRAAYEEAVSLARQGLDPMDSEDNRLRLRMVAASRAALADLRTSGAVGDEAYRRAEEELDWLELSAGRHGEARA